MGNVRRAGRLVGVAAGLGSLAVTGVAVAAARSLVTPKPRAMDTRIWAVDPEAGWIDIDANRDTSTPGRFGMFVTGARGYLQLGDVLSTGPATVRRALLTPIDTGDELGEFGSFSSWFYDEPDQLGRTFEPVTIAAPVGDCPAWLFAAKSARARASRTWVVHVHGRGVRRQECLRAIEVFHAAGMTSLVVSYRNDGDGAPTADGAYGLGATEWQDVDAAIAYAVEHGAERIILQAYSMGGAISFQTVLRGQHRDRIVGLVLDSPVVDWKSVLAVHAHEGRVPGPVAMLGMRLLKHPLTARLCGTHTPIDLDALDMNARADELDVPILLLVSSGDEYVPDGPAITLSRQRPDIVTRVQFSRPGHCALWNYDQQLWNGSIRNWLVANDLVASSGR